MSILKISKVYKSNGGLTAVSIDNESFSQITGRKPKLAEIKDSFHTVNGKNIRAFQFDNAKLVTSYNKEANKTRCYVSDNIVNELPRIDRTVGEYSNVNFDAFEENE